MADTAPAKPKKSNTLVLLVLLLIVLVAGGVGAWYWHNHKSTAPSTQAAISSSATWTTYMNNQYGFTFKYPKAWGSPQLTVVNSTNGGKHYSIVFSDGATGTGQSDYIVLSMDYADPANQVCASGQCYNTAALTSSSIDLQLKENKSALLVSDSTSYATIANLSKQKVSSLSGYQIVNLSKLGVSAATLTYQINNTSASCPQNQFAQSSSGGCVTQADYSNVNNVLKSIKST